MRVMELPDDYRLEAIWMYYGQMQESLLAVRKLALDGTQSLASFAGHTMTELENELFKMRQELDLEVSMALLAACEAIVRVDFKRRVNNRPKHPLTTQFRALFSAKENRVPFDDILDAWKSQSGAAQATGRLKQAVKYRDWLAHGRYWAQKSGIVNPSPEDILDRIQQFFEKHTDIF